MQQSAAVRPEPTFFRKAAIVRGAAIDHAGAVRVLPLAHFDLDRTIFKTLESPLARFVVKRRIGTEVYWSDAAARAVQTAYDAATGTRPLPGIDPELVRFLVERCDFDVEHADGSFLDHLYFCFEYATHHAPQHDPLVMFLHSILGTGTNTFAMPASEIDTLRGLVSPFVFRHVEAFPSVLRLLYTDLLDRLRAEAHRLDDLVEIRMHRVIDNAPISLSADDLWIALNYQLMHQVDFLPVADWDTNGNDNNLILFHAIRDLLIAVGKLDAKVDVEPARGTPEGPADLSGRVISWIPKSVSQTMARRSLARFSERIGHALDHELVWR